MLIKAPLCFENNVKWNVLNEVGLVNIHDLFAAYTHQKLREVVNGYLANLVHVVDFFIKRYHKLLEHKFNFNFSFILMSKHHVLSVLFFRFNLLQNAVQRNFRFTLFVRAILCPNKVSSFPHSHFDVGIQACDGGDDKFMNVLLSLRMKRSAQH